MSVWETYRARLDAQGSDKRTAILQRERRFLNAKIPSSLSYQQTTIDGTLRNLAIINTKNQDTKTICALPGEDLICGVYVEWMNERWLIKELDANKELHTKGIMQQCNYLLRWISDDGSIQSRWCIVDDGTKYLGEHENNVVTVGETKVSLILAKDEHTIRLNRGSRFLIDDYSSPSVLAYQLTKLFKLTGSSDGHGVLHFVMQECNTEDSDNIELHIANYYDHFPRTDHTDADQSQDKEKSQIGKKVWF